MIAARFGACFLLAALAITSQDSGPKSVTPHMAEPKLPVVDFHACGSGDFGIRLPSKIARQETMYSSWRHSRVSVGTLRPGDEYTLVGGVNIVREPDRAVVRNKMGGAPFLDPGDTVLGYGYDADGTTAFWSKGVWFREDAEHVSTKGADCGFADKTQCTIEIIKRGVQEWWVQVKTVGGSTAWVLGATFNRDKVWYSGNFDQMCRD
jgi:hypothetical protein